MWGSLKLYAKAVYLCTFFWGRYHGFCLIWPGIRGSEACRARCCSIGQGLQGISPSPCPWQLSCQDLQSNLTADGKVSSRNAK